MGQLSYQNDASGLTPHLSDNLADSDCIHLLVPTGCLQASSLASPCYVTPHTAHNGQSE